ncbi:MlaD family protein [Nocardia sp. NPDC051570]|uniref:MlaD family protein n=1 Tax=Nocardia sp. NPDC051570 TaxID=3364324 RepID=UPI00378ED2EC
MIRRLLIPLGTLAVLLIGSLGYLMFGLLPTDPVERELHIAFDLPRTGGLHERSAITVRGNPIGMITGLRVRADGVTAEATISAAYRIPRGSRVVVESLSAAGEEYVDLRPSSAAGPYVGDGTTFTRESISVPPDLGAVVGSVDGLLRGIDPADVASLSNAVNTSLASRGDLDVLLRNGVLMSSTLARNTDRLRAIVRNGHELLGLADDVNPDLRALLGAVPAVTDSLGDAREPLSDALSRDPAALATLSGLLPHILPQTERLLPDLTVLSGTTATHMYDLNDLIPNLAPLGETFAAMDDPHGTARLLVTLDPVPVCTYATPRLTIFDPPQPPALDGRCTDPDVNQRGPQHVPTP